LVVGTISSFPLVADGYEAQSDQVLQWLEEGKVLPFESLMKRHSKRLEGRLLDLEIEEEDGRIIYELEILRADSIVYEVKIDAQSGKWLAEEIEH
jgi:uncharacterized membrane protein YkoI